MATTRKKFINKCEDIIVAKPVYLKGASNTKKCDCIGMIKYSMRENGVSFSTTGSNYTFRNQVTNIRKITGASVLKVGDVVFKALAPGDPYYDLPPKYKEGGSQYNGDLNDYNHIGAVKSVNPLEIIHMTSPTAKRDTSIGKWKYAADMKSQYISDNGSSGSSSSGTSGSSSGTSSGSSAGSSSQQTTSDTFCTATVCAGKGSTVFLRAKPSRSCSVWEKVPVGTVVTVTSYKQDWCRVNYGKRKGWYMMTQFLNFG